jgi:hypothetical protein
VVSDVTHAMLLPSHLVDRRAAANPTWQEAT